MFVGWWVGGRWDVFADRDVVNVGRRELLEIVVNHAGDNIEDNALDLGEQCGPFTLGVAQFSWPHKSNISTELDHNYVIKGLFPANDAHPVCDVS